MSTININNAEFYYEIHGSGKPLVIIEETVSLYQIHKIS